MGESVDSLNSHLEDWSITDPLNEKHKIKCYPEDSRNSNICPWRVGKALTWGKIHLGKIMLPVYDRSSFHS